MRMQKGTRLAQVIQEQGLGLAAAAEIMEIDLNQDQAHLLGLI